MISYSEFWSMYVADKFTQAEIIFFSLASVHVIAVFITQTEIKVARKCKNGKARYN